MYIFICVCISGGSSRRTKLCGKRGQLLPNISPSASYETIAVYNEDWGSLRTPTLFVTFENYKDQLIRLDGETFFFLGGGEIKGVCH